MTYPEHFIGPMRAELSRHGIVEAHSVADVDRLLAPGSGSVLMVINSMCGCAAGKARPGIVMALQNAAHKPTTSATVFAGGDVEATARVRELLAGFPSSSPSVALFQDGKPVYMLHRRDIEQSDALKIAQTLTEAFDRHLSPVHSLQ